MSILNNHLLIWLQNAYSMITNDNYLYNHESHERILELFLLVSRTIFYLPKSMSITDVCAEISNIFQVECSENDLDTLIEYTLVHGVSENCDDRAKYVEGIMCLEADVQINLMQIIQEKMNFNNNNPTVNKPFIEEIINEPYSSNNSIESENINNSKKFVDVTNCTSCNDKELIMKKLQSEIEATHNKFVEETLKLKEDISIGNNKMVDLELVIIEKDDMIFNMEQKLLDYDKQQDKLKTCQVKISQLEEQILIYQDDIEVLKPQAMKYDHAEVQIEKFRQKLDELQDIKQQLKIESANHMETYDKLILLEQEVEQLRKLKIQLEEYRTQHVELSLSIQELQYRLEEKDIKLQKISNENLHLHNIQTNQRDQSNILQEELKITSEQLREKDRLHGIGEGISEFNPILMQELNRLKVENKEMHEKVEQTSMEHLEVLTKELSEQKVMTTSLQKKYISTKDALDKANKDIHTLTTKLQDKIMEFMMYSKQCNENQMMSQEDFDNHKNIFINKLSFIHKQYQHQLSLTHLGHNHVFDIYKESLHNAHEQLEETQCQLQDMSTLQATTKENLLQCEDHLKESNKKRTYLEMEYQDTITKLKAEHESDMNIKTNSFQEEKKMLEKQYITSINYEKQQIINLQTDLEQEAMKRRKIERQKKYHEMESQRQKNQLQAVNTTNGVNGEGIDNVLNEFKSMQQLLENANNEISILKSQLQSNNIDITNANNLTNDSETKSIIRSSKSSHSIKNSDITTNINNDLKVSTHTSLKSSLEYSCYMEQSEFSDKMIETLSKEKRELISKHLEEIKEKNEISQKLLVIEKENNILKDEIRKITLEKERNERKFMKQLEFSNKNTNQVLTNNKENII